MRKTYDDVPSDVVSNITQGRTISRLVSMFDGVDSLVEESDCRRCLEDDMPDDDSGAPEPEYSEE
jgi:hypothetical protein